MTTLFKLYSGNNSLPPAKERLQDQINNSARQQIKRFIDATKLFASTLLVHLTGGNRIAARQPKSTRSARRAHRKPASGDSDSDPAPSRTLNCLYLSPLLPRSIAAALKGGAQ